MWSLLRRTIEGESRLMGATYNFSLGFAQGTESNAKTPDRLLRRQPLQEICTGMSSRLLGLRDADHSEPTSGRPEWSLRRQFRCDAGGLGAILVGMAFLVAACLHWRF